MKTKFYSMLIALFMLLIGQCSTSQITVRKLALKQVKTVAIMPFEVVDEKSTGNKKVMIEAEEVLRGSLLKASFDIVEREKLIKVLAKSEVPKDDSIKLSSNNTTFDLIKQAKLLKADAVLVGKITDNRIIIRKITKKVLSTSGEGKNKKQVSNDVITKYTFVKYQIFLRLVSAVDGKTILTIHNQSEPRAVEDQEIPEEVLEQYRRKILSQIGNDIVSSVNKSRDS